MNRDDAIRIRSSLSRERQPLSAAEHALILRTSGGVFSLFAIVAATLASWPDPELQRAALVFAGIALVSAIVFAITAPKYMAAERKRIRAEAAEFDALVDDLIQVPLRGGPH